MTSSIGKTPNPVPQPNKTNTPPKVVNKVTEKTAKLTPSSIEKPASGKVKNLVKQFTSLESEADKIPNPKNLQTNENTPKQTSKESIDQKPNKIKTLVNEFESLQYKAEAKFRASAVQAEKADANIISDTKKSEVSQTPGAYSLLKETTEIIKDISSQYWGMRFLFEDSSFHSTKKLDDGLTKLKEKINLQLEKIDTSNPPHLKEVLKNKTKELHSWWAFLTFTSMHHTLWSAKKDPQEFDAKNKLILKNILSNEKSYPLIFKDDFYLDSVSSMFIMTTTLLWLDKKMDHAQQMIKTNLDFLTSLNKDFPAKTTIILINYLREPAIDSPEMIKGYLKLFKENMSHLSNFKADDLLKIKKELQSTIDNNLSRFPKSQNLSELKQTITLEFKNAIGLIDKIKK
jgi:hypothetical protein